MPIYVPNLSQLNIDACANHSEYSIYFLPVVFVYSFRLSFSCQLQEFSSLILVVIDVKLCDLYSLYFSLLLD